MSKFIIEIPDEFLKDFDINKVIRKTNFEDSMMRIITDIKSKSCELSGNYEVEILEMLLNSLLNKKDITDDMLSKKEVMRLLGECPVAYLNSPEEIQAKKDWIDFMYIISNSNFKEENSNENN